MGDKSKCQEVETGRDRTGIAEDGWVGQQGRDWWVSEGQSQLERLLLKTKDQ